MSTIEEGMNMAAASAHVNRHIKTYREWQEQLRHLQKEAFQMAFYYFMFQCIIFIGCYNGPADVRCRYRWMPFTLSLLAGFIYLCALSYLALTYKTTLDDMDKAMTRVAGDNSAPPSSDSVAGVRCEIGCMSLFIAFFIIMLVGNWMMACAQSESPAKPPATT